MPAQNGDTDGLNESAAGAPGRAGADAASSGEQPILDVTQMSIELNGRTILRDITLTLPRGANLAVIGPNGSGKTLFLRILLGLLPCHGGFHWLPEARLGYVPQKVAADPQVPMLVHELLEAKRRVLHLSRPDMTAAVEWVGIAGLLQHRLGTLSSGQLQRVLIALAMAGAPDVLIVDEPTSSLDEAVEAHIYEVLEKMRETRGTTIILASHDLLLVRQLATHVLCLNAGAASFGTAEQMLRPDVLEAVYGRPLQFHAHSLDHRIQHGEH